MSFKEHLNANRSHVPCEHRRFICDIGCVDDRVSVDISNALDVDDDDALLARLVSEVRECLRSISFVLADVAKVIVELCVFAFYERFGRTPAQRQCLEVASRVRVEQCSYKIEFGPWNSTTNVGKNETRFGGLYLLYRFANS